MEPKNAELVEMESRRVVTGSWQVGGLWRCWSKGTNLQLIDKFWGSKGHLLYRVIVYNIALQYIVM